MNYIKSLQHKAVAQKNQIKALEDSLNEIKRYLNSDKFSENPMVNKQDILLRIDEAISGAYYQFEETISLFNSVDNQA